MVKAQWQLAALGTVRATPRQQVAWEPFIHTIETWRRYDRERSPSGRVIPRSRMQLAKRSVTLPDSMKASSKLRFSRCGSTWRLQRSSGIRSLHRSAVKQMNKIYPALAKEKKVWESIYLSDHDHDCLTNLRFGDDVLLFATSKEQLQKCCATSRKVLKK